MVLDIWLERVALGLRDQQDPLGLLGLLGLRDLRGQRTVKLIVWLRVCSLVLAVTP